MRGRKRFIKSLNGELDRKIGALRTPLLYLIEGPNDSGKSIISQQYTYGALNQGFKVLYITTETGTKALINSMEQITLDVKYFFLIGLNAPNIDDLWNRREQDSDMDYNRSGNVSSVHSVLYLEISSKRSNPTQRSEET